MTVYKSESSTFIRNKPETEPETNLGLEDISEFDKDAVSGPDTELDTDSGPDMELDADSGPETELDTDSGADTELDTDSEVEMTSSSMFVEDMKIMWGDSSDLTLVCGNQQIPCHTSVLARRLGKLTWAIETFPKVEMVRYMLSL